MSTSTQCKFSKNGLYYTAYIPTELAKVGEYVKIKLDGDWDDGWKVEAVFTTLPAKYVQERSQDYKQTRKASDI